MNIKTKHLQVSRTARYVTYGSLTNKTKYIWIALHGSNMVAEQMVYKFKDFDPETHFILAPEGLSRFYVNGFSGDVVATWMTSRDRLHEIKDFSAYLSAVYELIPATILQKAKKIVLGFSQGGTTSFRWLHSRNIDIDYFIAYACWIPEDIDLQTSETLLNNIKFIYTYGTRDQYLTADRIEALKHIALKNKLTLQIEAYDGTHKVDRKQLYHIFKTQIIDQ